MARARRIDCSGPGISRRRRGRGFAYLGPDGGRIADPDALARIRALAVPPAWRDVWICCDERGHIQATGIDDAGRKQYLYHEDWQRRRAAAKFDTMVLFAQALPRLRRRVARDLRGDGLGAARVHACAVRLLDVGSFRVGGDDYARQNGSYGLTTLRKEHVRLLRDGLLFDFPAKSGQRRRQLVLDDDVRAVVAALRRRRGGGPDLLAHREGRRWVDLKAEDVNAYIKDAAGGAFTAKDFRTWNATALCALALADRADGLASSAARARAVRSAVAEVALLLGNTPAVCRRSYIDPRVIDRFDADLTIPRTPAGPLRRAPEAPIEEHPIEEPVRRAVLALIAGEQEAGGRRP
ncbi:MAG TPA: DNA topoisomerase IB [Solirubrobacteraceae bacterium]|nr:DNA topoisomerase IB [Solirubrobacteraceae bacterium]